MTGMLPRGAGLGVRRGLLPALRQAYGSLLDFMEVTPDNWIGTAGPATRQLRELAERFPFLAHGLSLSLGGPDPLDTGFIDQLKDFLDSHQVRCYSEHLSYCSADGHLYDLMPIPFTQEAVQHTAARIREVQERLGRRIAIENVSYYAAPFRDLDESTFINAVLAEADCDLLLDVNNVYVNSINHGYDPQAFIRSLPAARVAYLHMAGHMTADKTSEQDEDLRIDTHGSPVCDPVWDLLAFTYRHTGVKPTLLERDFNYPPIAELYAEVAQIRTLQQTAQQELSGAA